MVNKQYETLVDTIHRLIGGDENVSSLTHCATRLRFRLKDDARADQASLKKTAGILAVVVGNGQFQIVIGQQVEDVYDTYLSLHPVQGDSQASAGMEEKATGNIFTRALNTLPGILNPIVPALAGAGMIKALLVILTTSLGILDTGTSTYKILAAASNGVFYFLPLFLAISSAKTFKCNPYISLAIVAALLEPNFTKLMKAPGDIVEFLSLPVYLMNYTGTLVPALVAILAYAKLEQMLKKFIPKTIELFALPFCAILIMVPLTMIVIGPVGVILADSVGAFINYLSATNGLLTGLVIGAGWTFLVMFGIHWGVVPIMINNISAFGFDYIRPMVAAATFASAGAAVGIALRAKDKETRAFAFSTAIPALLGGITEPIIYGISLRYKRPLIAQAIGGGVAGAFMGMMHTKAMVYIFPALTTLPAFIGDTFVYYLMGITISFVTTAGITFFIGMPKKTDEKEDSTDKSLPTDSNEPVEIPDEVIVHSPLAGECIPLEEVKDEVFASKAMGDGVGILPQTTAGEKALLCSPVDGSLEFVFPTKHAVGIRSFDGTEFLLHIGINTVEMNGEGFEVLQKEKAVVKKGMPLIAFDIDTIKNAGYDTTTLCLVTKKNEAQELVKNNEVNHKQLKAEDAVFSIRRKEA